MRVLVRTELDHNKPINLKKLTPYEKVKAGIISQIRQNNFYLKLKRQKEEEEYLRSLKEDETLKNLILAELYAELNQNRTLSKKDLICNEVIVTVDAKFLPSLKRLLPNLFFDEGEPHKDFLPFNIERVKENADIRRAFSDMPVLLRASAKRI